MVLLHQKLKNFLKNFSAEEKITILNYYREGIKTERNAYTQGSQFVKKYKGTKLGCIMEQSSPKEYDFDKKIKYVENLLRKTIKEERHRLKKVFKSN